ncbi:MULTISPECIES: ParB/RepB/Spo0J family partition protein [Natrialbaceae]|uniref:ParB/RepB/Spo0J family partition protein n=1 Tax=Natrialbaceae TaxID=1644061 RepID=UPI00207C14A2|nr:ParB N-terminal domain-containing protein [Natronococcus sp. CG52]
MSSATDVETRDPNDLTPHPKNDEIYGDGAPDWFVESIENKGIREPIVITEESNFDDSEVIISGHRRHDAAMKAGLEEVPVRFEEYETAAEELEALVDYNQQREKNFSQKIREALELESVERSRAKGRQGTRTDLDQNFGGSQFGTSAEKVAEMVGFGNPETYRQARKVWVKKEEGYDWAEELVESLDEGKESVYGAFQEVEKREQWAENREAVEWEELEGLEYVYTPADLVRLFDELQSESKENDWWATVDSLYAELADRHEDLDGGFHFAVDRGKYEVFQAFLYLLEKEGKVTFDGDTSSPEPSSLVDKKPDAETLEELYWDEDMRRGEIGLRYNVHPLLVGIWMYEEDIPRKRGGLNESTQERIDEQRGDAENTDSS